MPALINIFPWGILAYACVAPLTIAGSGIVIWPLIVLWILGARQTFSVARPVWGPPEKAFLFFLVVSLFAAAFAGEVPRAFRIVFKKEAYFLILIFLSAWLSAEESQRERYARAFLIVGTFSALWGILSYGIGIDQTDCHDGRILSLPTAVSAWPRWLIDQLTMVQGRAVASRCHPLTYAGSLLMVLSLSLAALVSAKGKRVFVYLGICWAIGAALIFSQSRGPWIAAAVMALLAVVLVRTPAALKRVLCLGLPALFLLLSPSLRARAASLLDKNYNSNSERMRMWEVGWELWKKNPVLGIGPGNVKRVVKPYLTPDQLVDGGWPHLHNIFVNVAVERGTLGLIAFILWLTVLFREILTAWYRETAFGGRTPVLVLAGLLALVGFIINGFTQTVYNDEALLFAFYGVMGVALAAARQKRA